MQTRTDDEASALRSRLAELQQRYSQAEIARRTGVTASNVSRYMQGHKVPALFLTGLAREFGLNSDWLLLGEGSAWVAEVSPESAKLTGGLLDLVKSLSRVTRLRLGALTDRKDAKALRELDDALDAYDREKNRLANETRDAYSHLLGEWKHALVEGRLDDARMLHASTAQLSRLCPDPDLEMQRLEALTSHYQHMGKLEDSLNARRSLFLAGFGVGGRFDEKSMVAALRLVASLEGMGNYAEAIRYAKAAIALTPPDGREWPAYPMALALYGLSLSRSGQPGRGMAKLTEARSLDRSGRARKAILAGITWNMYMTGAADLEACAALSEEVPLVLRGLLVLSPWCLDAKVVRQLLQRFRTVESGSRFPEEHVAQIHLAALENRAEDALRELAEAEELNSDAARHEPSIPFTMGILRTQVHRLLGEKGKARKVFRIAEKARKAIPREISIEADWERVHWRNAYELFDQRSAEGRTTLSKAKKFWAWATEHGFGACDPTR